MATNKSEEKEIILVVYNTQDAEGVSLALAKADISCVRRKIGAGKHGNFLLALNNYGEEISVAPEDMERAQQVIEAWREQKNAARKQEQIQEAAEETGEEQEQKRKTLYARIFAGIVLVTVVVFYLWKNH